VHRFGGIDQRVFRDREEIGIAARDRAQVAIFELLGAPKLCKFGTLAWKRLLDFRNDGIGVKK
jgi:hypothetical protein